MYDVVIIGAGVTGAMIARTLSAYKLKICIVEKSNDVATGATRANSAIVHAGFDAPEGSLKAKLNVMGSNLMPAVARELGVKYQNNGSMVIGFDDNDRKTIEELARRGRKNGVRGLAILEREDILKKEPNISPEVTCALYAPTGAIVCPYELTIAAVGNAMDNGAELKRSFEVVSIASKGDYYTVSSAKESIDARFVVNAAGLNADKIAAMAGDESFSVTPRRGEYILLDKSLGNIVSSTIFRTPSKMGKGILVTPTVDGNLLTGPTSENIDDKENTATTAKGLGKIIAMAKENIPSISYAGSITSFCGLRAVGSTGDFIINSPTRGFVNVAGIESPGLSSAPAIALMVRDILAEGGLELVPDSGYNPLREPMDAFREADIWEKNRIIASDNTYGRIICRCEGVTEGEIRKAIRTNPIPLDMDGVKRRTRAQMGRCQGGFCSSYIMELLAEELGVPKESITKSGGKSLIVTAKTKEVEDR